MLKGLGLEEIARCSVKLQTHLSTSLQCSWVICIWTSQAKVSQWPHSAWHRRQHTKLVWGKRLALQISTNISRASENSASQMLLLENRRKKKFHLIKHGYHRKKQKRRSPTETSCLSSKWDSSQSEMPKSAGQWAKDHTNSNGNINNMCYWKKLQMKKAKNLRLVVAQNQSCQESL